MALRKPVVMIAGALQELPATDTIASGSATASVVRNSYAGTLTPTTGTVRWYPDRAVTLASVYFSLGVASSGAVTIDVRKNGATVFSGTVPTGTAGAYLSSTVSVTTTLTTADYLTVDITAATDGANLTTTITYN